MLRYGWSSSGGRGPLALLSMPVRLLRRPTGTALRAAFRSRSAVDARKAPASPNGHGLRPPFGRALLSMPVRPKVRRTWPVWGEGGPLRRRGRGPPSPQAPQPLPSALLLGRMRGEKWHAGRPLVFRSPGDTEKGCREGRARLSSPAVRLLSSVCFLGKRGGWRDTKTVPSSAGLPVIREKGRGDGSPRKICLNVPTAGRRPRAGERRNPASGRRAARSLHSRASGPAGRRRVRKDGPRSGGNARGRPPA